MLNRLGAIGAIALCAGLAFAPYARAAARAPALSVTVQVQQNSLDLLDSLAIEVIVHNPTKALVTASFAKPQEYAIDVVRGDDAIWSSLPKSERTLAVTRHTHTFAPGATTLVVYEWNELSSDRRSPLPGRYEVRARLLSGDNPSGSTHVRFVPPYPVAGLAKLEPGEIVTLSGRLDPPRATLTDATGTIALARRLPLAPADEPIALRGFTSRTPNGTLEFNTRRWAPLGPPAPAPSQPPATPQPEPTSSR